MNECVLYSKVGTIVNRWAASMCADSMYHQEKEAEAFRTAHPDSCTPPDLFIARFNGHMLRAVQKPAKKFSCLGDGLNTLIEAAVEIANHSLAEIPIHGTSAGLDLFAPIESVLDAARQYQQATSQAAANEAAMVCAKALETYGRALITKYGSAADISNTQLRILRTWILASMTHPMGV